MITLIIGLGLGWLVAWFRLDYYKTMNLEGTILGLRRAYNDLNQQYLKLELDTLEFQANKQKQLIQDQRRKHNDRLKELGG